MDFSHRIGTTFPYLALLFCAGLAIAVWDPRPKLILSVALSISTGMLVLGPYAASALYGTRLQTFWHGNLRLPVCLVLALSTVFIMDHFISWPREQLVLSALTATVGTILGHDATLAVLGLRSAPGHLLDVGMVVLFPIIAGLAALAGFCSLGFGLGTYHFLLAFSS